jgi:hypothetical protein
VCVCVGGGRGRGIKLGQYRKSFIFLSFGLCFILLSDKEHLVKAETALHRVQFIKHHAENNESIQTGSCLTSFLRGAV